MEKAKKVLFVSYNSAIEPVVRSQVLPYLAAISKDGIKFSLLTFERGLAGADEVLDELRLSDIEWIRRTFHRRPIFIAKLFDIINGLFTIWWLNIFKGIRIVHTRGVIASLMALLPTKIFGNAYFIFDMKSSLAEAYRLSGRLKTGSLTYKILTFAEKICILNADEIIVETDAHKRSLELMISSRERRPNISVLPCCVDMKRFCAKKEEGVSSLAKTPRIVYLGSVSGWYLFSEMLDFFKALKDRFSQAKFLFLSDDKESIVARLAQEKRIEDVRIYRVPYKDVCKELISSTAGILFKEPNDRLDSFPIKIGEYLASGLPIIINHGMGDVEKLIAEERVGVIVDSFNEMAYKNAISALEKLLAEGETLRNRCMEVASRRLSSEYGLEIYRAAYQRAL